MIKRKHIGRDPTSSGFCWKTPSNQLFYVGWDTALGFMNCKRIQDKPLCLEHMVVDIGRDGAIWVSEHPSVSWGRWVRKSKRPAKGQHGGERGLFYGTPPALLQSQGSGFSVVSGFTWFRVLVRLFVFFWWFKVVLVVLVVYVIFWFFSVRGGPLF